MTTTIQTNVSLIPLIGQPVFTQGNEGDCAACATRNIISAMTGLYGNPFLSNPQTQYNMILQAEGELGIDFGTYPVTMLNLLQTAGLTQNSDMPYGVVYDGIAPNAADVADAKLHVINSWNSIPVGASAENTLAWVIAQSLLQIKPLMLAFTVCAGFQAEENIPQLANQNGNDTGAVDGGHMAVIVGCNTNTNMLTVASWGPAYGDEGYFELSLDNFYGTEQNQLDIQGLYTINGFNGVDLTQNANTAAVACAFVALLNRAPAQSGMQANVAAMASGSTISNICDSIIASAEFQTDIGPSPTAATFIQLLFNNVLGRPAAAGGLAAYEAQIAAGASWGTVAAAIIGAVYNPTGLSTTGRTVPDWAFNIWMGDGSVVGPAFPAANVDPNMMNESLMFQNKVQVAQNVAIALQAPGGYTSVLKSVLTTVTTDPASVISSLIGIPQQLGHPPIVSPVL